MVEYHPQKDEPNSTWLEVGGNLIEYPGDVVTPTANTTPAKNMCNSVVSMTKAKYMYIGINKKYLGFPLNRCEYLRIPITLIPY